MPATTKKQIHTKCLFHNCATISQSVIVSACLYELGCNDLMFGEHYGLMLLSTVPATAAAEDLSFNSTENIF